MKAPEKAGEEGKDQESLEWLMKMETGRMGFVVAARHVAHVRCNSTIGNQNSGFYYILCNFRLKPTFILPYFKKCKAA